MQACSVAQRISSRWRARLSFEILDMPDDCEVGRRCVTLCQKADELLALMDEESQSHLVETATLEQCEIWYFG